MLYYFRLQPGPPLATLVSGSMLGAMDLHTPAAARSPSGNAVAARGAPAVLNWQELIALPAFAEFYRLIRRLFGINIALISPDAHYGRMLGPGRETNPFCRAVQACEGGLARCQACDAEHARLAKRNQQPLRYTCHAGLTEFIIPIVVDNDVIALLQCGQVLERAPGLGDWKPVRQRLNWVTGRTRNLAIAFRRTKVLSAATQEDLVSLLKLIAHHAATAHARKLQLELRHQDRIVSRTLTYLRQHFREKLSLTQVSIAVGASTRNLTRLLRVCTGATLVEHLHRLRIAYACELLTQTNAKIAAVVLASGFGSVQQFDRVFRQRTGRTPAEWRAKVRRGRQ